jgi:glycosyltransferase involved in cell wall biosynthesis
MRLAAYEDAVYHRLDGVLTAERAFPVFMFGLAEEVDHLVVLGRLDPAPSRSHYEPPAGAEFVALPHYESLTRPLAVLRALAGTLRRFWSVLGRVDAVWLNGPSPMAIAMAVLALARRRRVVLGVRQSTMEYARRRHPGNHAALAAFRAMEAVWRALARVAPVTAVGPQIAREYAGARAVHELSVSFVTERDLAGPEVAAARDYAGEVRVLSVGRLETEKNPLLLADVLAELVRGGGRWRLVVVGEGALEAPLRARLEELGVSAHADLLGYVPLDRGLPDVYRGAGIFLHVSWTEGLPQVLLEAFAARLPVVATEVGGVGPVARGAALLVPAGDAGAAAAAVRRLAGDAALREQLAEAGIARVRERTAEAERRRLAAFIRSGGHARPRRPARR